MLPFSVYFLFHSVISNVGISYLHCGQVAVSDEVLATRPPEFLSVVAVIAFFSALAVAVVLWKRFRLSTLTLFIVVSPLYSPAGGLTVFKLLASAFSGKFLFEDRTVIFLFEPSR